MIDERETPDPRMVALIADAVARQIANVGRKELVDTPPTITGRDAMAMQEIARHAVDERLRDRGLLSETQIRVIAKDVAQAVADQTIRPVQDGMRSFLTEKEIEAIVVEILRKMGLRADDEHIDETRQVIEGIIRGYRRRNEVALDLFKETLKALAVMVATTVVGYLAFFKGVSPK